MSKASLVLSGVVTFFFFMLGSNSFASCDADDFDTSGALSFETRLAQVDQRISSLNQNITELRTRESASETVSQRDDSEREFNRAGSYQNEVATIKGIASSHNVYYLLPHLETKLICLGKIRTELLVLAEFERELDRILPGSLDSSQDLVDFGRRLRKVTDLKKLIATKQDSLIATGSSQTSDAWIYREAARVFFNSDPSSRGSILYKIQERVAAAFPSTYRLVAPEKFEKLAEYADLIQQQIHSPLQSRGDLLEIGARVKLSREWTAFLNSLIAKHQASEPQLASLYQLLIQSCRYSIPALYTRERLTEEHFLALEADYSAVKALTKTKLTDVDFIEGIIRMNRSAALAQTIEGHRQSIMAFGNSGVIQYFAGYLQNGLDRLKASVPARFFKVSKATQADCLKYTTLIQREVVGTSKDEILVRFSQWEKFLKLRVSDAVWSPVEDAHELYSGLLKYLNKKKETSLKRVTN